MKKIISILAIAAVAALAFVSCSKGSQAAKEPDVKGDYYLSYDVLDDTNLNEEQMDYLEDILDEEVEGVEWEDTYLSEVVKQVNDLVKEKGPSIASQFPDNYFTIQFEIVNDMKEVVKNINVKCQNGKVL